MNNEKELLKTFYKQISNKNRKDLIDVSKGKFLIEFFKKNSTEFVKTDLLKNSDNILLQENQGLSIPSFLYKNENKDLIFLGSSKFSKINTSDKEKESRVTEVHLNTLNFENLSDSDNTSYKKLTHTDGVTITSSIPKYKDGKILIENNANKIISSDYENGENFFQLESIESSESEEGYTDIIPKNENIVFNIEKIDLTNSHTELQTINYNFSKQNDNEIIKVTIQNETFNKFQLKSLQSKLESIKDNWEEDIVYVLHISTSQENIDESYSYSYLFCSAGDNFLPNNYTKIDTNDLEDLNYYVIIMFPNNLLPDTEESINSFKNHFNNVFGGKIKIKYQAESDDEPNSHLGFAYNSNLLYEISENEGPSGKFKAGRNIELKKFNKLYFFKNIEIEEGNNISYDSILQFARTDYDSNQNYFYIEYEETPSDKCKFKIDGNKIIIYVSEIIEEEDM